MVGAVFEHFFQYLIFSIKMFQKCFYIFTKKVISQMPVFNLDPVTVYFVLIFEGLAFFNLENSSNTTNKNYFIVKTLDC